MRRQIAAEVMTAWPAASPEGTHGAAGSRLSQSIAARRQHEWRLVDPTTTHERRVGGIDDCIDLLVDDVADDYTNMFQNIKVASSVES
jgi:hypothetical protein